MKTSVYITVRLNIEFEPAKFTNEEEAREYAVQEKLYDFPLDREDICITGSEICGINM